MEPQETGPLPVQSYILKVASRCNLNCSYCYVYNKGDLSYKDQPVRMSPRVVEATIDRVRRHCLRHDLKTVEFIFHGGEPLLAGKEFFRNFIKAAKNALPTDVEPSFNMQTNGALLDAEWLDLLADVGIGFGISLDGPKEIHDRNRVDHAGRGSFDQVRRAIDLALNHGRARQLFGGLLTVVNLEMDPAEAYRFYRGLGVPGVDFLLPDGHFGSLPPRISLEGNSAPYGDWLIRVFEKWFEEGDSSFHIRFFENIMDLLFGGLKTTDYIGGAQNSTVVVETDGGLEPLDVLKICGDRFTKVGYSVLTNDIDDVNGSALVRKYQSGKDGASLSDKCRRCRVVDVCGGGYLPHRFNPKTGFNNPSVYCRDLERLISHIRERMLSTIPVGVRYKLGFAAQAAVA